MFQLKKSARPNSRKEMYDLTNFIRLMKHALDGVKNNERAENNNKANKTNIDFTKYDTNIMLDIFLNKNKDLKRFSDGFLNNGWEATLKNPYERENEFKQLVVQFQKKINQVCILKLIKTITYTYLYQFFMYYSFGFSWRGQMTKMTSTKRT